MKLRFALPLLAALAVFLSPAPVLAAEQAAPAAAAPKRTEEETALLKALDAEIVRFDKMITEVDDTKYVAFLKEQSQDFKNRRDVMYKTAWDTGRYDELRFDISIEIQRVAQWHLPSPPPRASK